MIILDGYNGGGTDFYDSFNRSNGAPGNGWTPSSDAPGIDPVINSNACRFEIPTAFGKSYLDRVELNSSSNISVASVTTIGMDFNYVSNSGAAGILGLFLYYKPFGTSSSDPYFFAEPIDGRVGIAGASTDTPFVITDNTWYSMEMATFKTGASTVDVFLKVWERSGAKPAAWTVEVVGGVLDKKDEFLRVEHITSTDGTAPASIVDIDNLFYIET